MGYTKTALLMAAMTALFMGLGYLLAGAGGMLFALVLAAGMNLFTWWNSDKMVLRLHNARPVSFGDHTGLSQMVGVKNSNRFRESKLSGCDGGEVNSKRSFRK